MTDKRKAFISAYVGKANGNATEAARIAGYAEPKEEGYRLKNDARIRAEIDRLMAEKCMPADEVLSRLAEQARGIGEYVIAAKRGVPRIDMNRLVEDGKGHLVKCVKETAHGTTIEFYDAQAALVHIGRTHKLFVDKTESSLTVEGIVGYEIVEPAGGSGPGADHAGEEAQAQPASGPVEGVE